MADDPTTTDAPEPPDPGQLRADPDALKQAHQKYGDYLKKVGLPFEPEELDDESESDRASLTDAAGDDSGRAVSGDEA